MNDGVVSTPSRRLTVVWLVALAGMLFVGGGLLGELSGSFADPDGQFAAVHDGQSQRIMFIAGGGLLAASGIAAIPSVILLLMRTPLAHWRASHVCALAFAGLFAALLVASGSAYAAVSLSRELATLFDDRGQFETGVAVLPQFAWVLFLWAIVAGAAMIVAVAASLDARTRRVGALRRACAAAVLLAVLSLGAPPFIAVLPMWLIAVALVAPPTAVRID